MRLRRSSFSRLSLISLGLLATVAFYFSFFGKGFVLESTELGSTVSAAAIAPAPPSAQHKADRARPAVDGSRTSRASTPSENDEALRECWKKINSQVVETEEFKAGLASKLGAIIDPWFYWKDEPLPDDPVRSASSLFYFALARAGFLESRQYERDDEQALRMLAEAHEADPDNSAPLIFASAIERRRGREAESERLLEIAKVGCRRFDSYLTQITQGVARAVRTPADYLSALSIVSTVPVPNYSTVQSLLRGDAGAGTFAEQMMRDGLDTRKKNEVFDYIFVEYAIGRSLLAGKPDQADYPTSRELLVIKPPTSLLGERAMTALEDNCDLSTLEPFIRELPY